MKTTRILLVMTTMPDSVAAETMARTLVEERLAACVQVHGPMVSLYRWMGAVQRDTEHQVVIKTAPGQLVALEQRLRALHPYALPELVVVEGAASEEYGDWVLAEAGGRATRRGAGPPAVRTGRAASRRTRSRS